jgi:hypothetical protein
MVVGAEPIRFGRRMAARTEVGSMLLRAIPEGRDGRWRLAIEFAGHWVRPPGETDRVSPARLDAAEARLGLPLPAALREWYERLGCRGDLWSVQDTFLPPEELTLRGDLLAFYVENQAVWFIGVGRGDLSADDPPVLIDERDFAERARALSPSISLLALQMLAYAVKFARPVGEHLFGSWTEATLQAVGRHYARSALPPLGLFGQDTTFYEGPDALIEVSGGDCYLYPTFRSDEARRRFERVIAGTGFEWEM